MSIDSAPHEIFKLENIISNKSVEWVVNSL